MILNWGFLLAVHWADVAATMVLLSIGVGVAIYIYNKDFKRTDEKIGDLQGEVNYKMSQLERKIEEKFMYGIERVTHAIEVSQAETKAIRMLFERHINDEDRRFESIESVLHKNTEVLNRIDLDMVKYRITNAEVAEDDITKIEKALLPCSIESIEVLLPDLINDNELTNEQIIDKVAAVTQEHGVRENIDLIASGVSPKTISIWKQSREDTFKKFAFDIINWYNDSLKSSEKLKRKSAKELSESIFNEFMSNLKGKMRV